MTGKAIGGVQVAGARLGQVSFKESKCSEVVYCAAPCKRDWSQLCARVRGATCVMRSAEDEKSWGL